MTRVKAGVVTRRRHKKIFKANKGFMGRQKNVWRIAKQANMKAGRHAYRGRKLKKREYRSLWINRINAAVRDAGLTYSRFIDGLMHAKVALNRKQLSELAINSPEIFATLVETAKKHTKVPARKEVAR